MFFTPKRRLGFSVPSSPATFTTPRSEKRSSDLRWADAGYVSSSSSHDRDKEVNAHVVVRCRPLSEEEQKQNVQNVVLCNEQKREVAVLQSMVSRLSDKTFTFDKVFGPKSQQRSLYDHAISPLVGDILNGFNCTVFAYGQTGTGKTYTMEGGMKYVKGEELPADAGVIPRAVRQIFDTLDAQKADYTMKVTFLELYNEEITDLLAVEDSDRHGEEKLRRPISLLEDGKGGAVIRGLEEEVVYSANDIFNLLERGSARRRVADTLLNKQSSRSHSIFSITIYIKETLVGDEELMKCGRLNLVDLAGSENVSRSGARESRAREAGELNKSLLTLGRVITALVDHSGHIPYRDSKLTRLLRESLGGKAKTCIIATISPSIHCLEETLSTLDYAYRAKSIRNKPEANQKMSKFVLLKDLHLEIERLKQDVKSAREKNGVYIPSERYAEDEAQRKAMSVKIKNLELDVKHQKKQADALHEVYNAEKERNSNLQNEIKTCKANMENLTKEVKCLQEKDRINCLLLKEKEYVISRLLTSENAILGRAKDMHLDLQITSKTVSKLYTRIDRKAKLATENESLVMNFGSQLNQSLEHLHQSVLCSLSQQYQLLKCMEDQSNMFISRKCEETKSMDSKIGNLKYKHCLGVAAMKELACALQNKGSSNAEEIKSILTTKTMVIENFLVTAASEAEEVLAYVEKSFDSQRQLLSFVAQQQEMKLHRTLLSTQMISKTTLEFFHDLHSQASKLMTSIEESHKEKMAEFESFKKNFQESSAKDEEVAVKKISRILRSLNAKRVNRVSESIDTMSASNTEREMMVVRELSDMKAVASDAPKHWIEYTENAENQFQEDIFSTVTNNATMENILHEGSKGVGLSMQHWKDAHLSIDHLTKECVTESDCLLEKWKLESCNLLEEFTSSTLSIDAELVKGTSDLLDCTQKALVLDHEAKKTSDTILSSSLDQLNMLQGSHAKNIAYVKDYTEYCLKEYQVDHPAHATPRKQPKAFNFESVESLKAPPVDDLVRDFRSENRLSLEGCKAKDQQYMMPGTPRSPLTDIN